MLLILKQLIRYLLLSVVLLGNIMAFSQAQPTQPQTKDDIINKVLNEQEITKIKETASNQNLKWAIGIQQFGIEVLTNILRPLIILVGLIVAIIWFYGLMSSEKAEDITKSLNYIIRGSIGVVVLFFAPFFVNQLVGETGQIWIIEQLKNILLGGSAVTLGNALYTVISPLLRLAFYIIWGVLFIMLLVNAIQLLFNPNDDITTKARVMFTWNAIWIVIIVLSKTIVERIYGQEGKTIIENPDLSWLGAIISRGIGFLAFIMLGMMIYIGFSLITRPLDQDNFARLKRSIIYLAIGLLLMWWAYLVARFLIIQ